MYLFPSIYFRINSNTIWGNLGAPRDCKKETDDQDWLEKQPIDLSCYDLKR